MFELTPQEKTALVALLCICLCGAAVECALNKHFKPMQWANTAARHPVVVRPDINTANATDLDRIPGVGPKTAQNIVSYRTVHGRFSSLDNLKSVKGITKRSFKKIKDFYERRDDGSNP